MNLLVRRSATAIGAATIALGLTAGLAPSAYAEKVIRRDAAGDIHKTTWDSGRETDMPARNAAQPDIRRVVVRYQQNRLLIRVKHADLSQRTGRYDVLRVRTPKGGAFGAWQVPKAGAWQGSGAFYRFDDPGKPCAGVVHRFDYRHDVTTWSVPASCFGSPRWVRVGVSARWSPPRTPEKHVLYGDSAFAKGDPATRNTLSRRIKRG